MTITYRIQKSKHNTSILSGEGASISPGRWNMLGTPMVYTSPTPSLCILELRVHMDQSLLPLLPPHSLITMTIPDNCITEIPRAQLPADWNAVPATLSSQSFLTPHFESNSSLGFKLPSVVSPSEYNIVLNPNHPDIDKVTILDIVPFAFDYRLFV